MSSILTAFSEFVASHRHTLYRENVDLTSLIEICSTKTPTLKLSMMSDDASDLAEVIVRNVCKYAPNRKFPIYGLRAIERIVSKDIVIEETKLQQIYLIHLTKANMDVDTISKMIILELDSMTAEIQIDEVVEAWISVANATIQHTHIGNIIDELISNTLGAHLAGKISGTRGKEVEVSFISSISTLRGFSGFNVVYINKSYFDGKFHGSNRSGDLVMIDIATVAIHELAHVRVRQVIDDLNSSTPALTLAPNENDREFGRIVERRIFGSAIDWLASIHNVPESFVKSFLKSIRTNVDLPTFPENSVIYARSHPLTFYGGAGAGADILQDIVL